MSAQKPRRTLATYGRRGDRVRVLVDAGRGRVEVLYRDAEGIPRKRIFGDDRIGRAEATAWAETYHQERAKRAKGGAEIPATTIRQLWREYMQGLAWQQLRAQSRPNYADRWRLWAGFIGDTTIAADVRLRDIERFITRMQELPTAQGKPRSLNQIRQVLNVARTVFNWGQQRELVARNDFSLFRWKTPKDVVPLEPEEYTAAECAKLLRELSPQHPKRWRANVAILLASASGMRANAVRHLRWRDIDWARDVIVWPAEFQKQGKALERPITPDLRAALWTARVWRDRMAGVAPKRRTSRANPERLALADWVLFAEHDRAQPVSYQSLHTMLTKAEDAVGIVHRPFRGLHGFRRYVVSEIGERTGDLMLGLEFVGDTDPKMLRSYDRRRATRIAQASDALASEVFPNRSSVPETQTAPADTGAVTLNTAETYADEA